MTQVRSVTQLQRHSQRSANQFSVSFFLKTRNISFTKQVLSIVKFPENYDNDI